MVQTTTQPPSFNLWTEPWITVERSDAHLEILSLAQTLAEAPRIRALYEPSPLVVVAIHRLLVAILQDVFHPESLDDLKYLWQAKQFSAEALQKFGETYNHRFDLFSEDMPFLQSADLPQQPLKKDSPKPIGYLLLEQPAGTAVTHYTHAYDQGQQFCSHCVAKGLLLIPAFALAGGSGIKPSINGVPPIYVLPGGETLFDSLCASLILPGFKPPEFEAEQREDDSPWWKRRAMVKKKAIVTSVGYLHGLTFPARRVRLHPLAGNKPCTRCGQRTPWHVASMIYEMGERLPKDAPWWRDPFAAYCPPKKESEQRPTPIRPCAGQAIWREFTGLFLPNRHNYRPNILNQLEVMRDGLPYQDSIPLRVIGLRTDKRMKIFEWQESGFQIKPRLLTDLESARNIERGLEFAGRCEWLMKKIFRDYFGGAGKDKRFEVSISDMSRRYWQELGQKFHLHIQAYTAEANHEQLGEQWLNDVVSTGIDVFWEAAETVPTNGFAKKPDSLKTYKNINRQSISKTRLQQEAINECRFSLYGYRKKYDS